MNLSIIIPTYKRNDIFHETIDHVQEAIKGIDAEVIIVNDFKNDSIKLDKSRYRNFLVYNNPMNGVASARNYGFSKSTGEIILFLDNDILISKAAIQDSIKVINQNPNAVLNVNWFYPKNLMKKLNTFQFGRFLIKNNLTSLEGWMENTGWYENEIFEIEDVASYFLMMRRNTFIKTGGYNEKFPYAGFEDFENAQRIKKLGIKRLLDTRITVFHNENDRSDIYDWLNRQERGGNSRIIAVNIGYTQMKINYSMIKRNIYKFLSKNQSILHSIINLIPNNKLCDVITFRLIKTLQGTRIYIGYSSK